MFRNHDLSGDVETLHFGATDSKPVDAEWDSDGLLNDEWSFWDVTEATLDDEREDDGKLEVDVVVNGHGTITAVRDREGTLVLLGHRGDADDYADEHEDEEGEPETGRLTRDQLATLENASAFDGDVISEAEGPMMNYWYPLEGISDETEASEAALGLSGLPLCVVEVDGSYGLALTGGGMDLSWEIAEAYVRLGMLPPVHFADLPSMAGKYPGSESGPAVTRAMLRALRAQAERLSRSAERLQEKYPTWS
jgi:hypothetical protein